MREVGQMFDYNRNMSPALRRRVASLITTVIMGYILYRVLERIYVVIWVAVPWWGLVILGILLFVGIDFMVNRMLGAGQSETTQK
jgi:hypothetical protein